MTNKKELKNELDKICKTIARYDDEKILSEGIGKQFAIELQKKWPNNTDAWATCIASMCIQIDRDTDCRKLLIEWFHERYGGFVVEGLLPLIHETRDLLKGLKYDRNDPIDGPGDTQAWLDSDNVFIIEDQHVRMAVIIQEDELGHYVLHVRKLRYKWDSQSKQKYWGYPSLSAMRKSNWKVKYGDFRDSGYILSYGGFMSEKKVDGALAYWRDLEHFIFRVKNLNENVREGQTARRGEVQEKPKKVAKKKSAKKVAK